MDKIPIIKTIILLVGFNLISDIINAQTFEEWKLQQKEEFQEYKDKFDQEFINMLKSTWEEVGITTGLKFYENEKPIELPIFTPTSPPDFNIQSDTPKDEIIENPINTELDVNFDAIPPDIPTAPVLMDNLVALFDEF